MVFTHVQTGTRALIYTRPAKLDNKGES